ncbi:unnamed protein product [Rhizophagus irregularis]|nr:unnamed protein product [Rhizophagus irregularis]
MYKEKEVYFISNLTNLNSELCQFQESDISSLLGLVLRSKNEKLRLDLPKLTSLYSNYPICKINVKKILSKDCSIKFISSDDHKEHTLKHEVVSKLEGLGWIEYVIPTLCSYDFQFSIEINSIEMITHIPNVGLMGYLLPDYHQMCPNVPETFGDMYFSRKEMENLLDLKDILNK